MNKKILSLFLIVLVSLVVVGLVVQDQLSSLQTQVNELQTQNSELESQLSVLQDQFDELLLEKRELNDRLNDYSLELVKDRNLKLEITDFVWKGASTPVVGVTLAHSYNVTIKNDEAVPIFGLKLTATLIRGGIKIGDEGTMQISRLNRGMMEVSGFGPLTVLGTDLKGAMCLVQLSLGDKTIDEYTGHIG